jgi:hypothetical protein
MTDARKEPVGKRQLERPVHRWDAIEVNNNEVCSKYPYLKARS